MAPVDRFVAALAVRRVVDLRLPPLGGPTIAALATAARFERLRWLDLYGSSLDDAGLAALARLPAFAQVTHLLLQNTAISLKGGARLAKEPAALPELTVFLLGESDDDDPPARRNRVKDALSRGVGGGAMVFGYYEGGA